MAVASVTVFGRNQKTRRYYKKTMIPTYEQIKPYIEKKLVSEQVHPNDPAVRIFNYTQACQFSKEWDEVTMRCRGLILNVVTGKVLANPFPKFFNVGEHTTKGLPIPNEVPSVTEKLDGSLGILYFLDGKPWIATRGSFTSEQAVWATNWFRQNVDASNLLSGYTHLFEIIYPENRIVVNYDFSGLVWLASRCIADGSETGWPFITKNLNIPFRMRGQIPASVSLDMIALMDEKNSEGFVIHYQGEGLRLKVKFPEYVRLHKLVTGVSEIAIWETLRDGKTLDEFLEKVPDEFFNWVRGVESRLKADFDTIWLAACDAVAKVEEMPSRKEQAQWIMQNSQRTSGVAFPILDGQYERAAQCVWKMVRPRGANVFKIDET